MSLWYKNENTAELQGRKSKMPKVRHYLVYRIIQSCFLKIRPLVLRRVSSPAIA